jgi:hypothetical protein
LWQICETPRLIAVRFQKLFFSETVYAIVSVDPFRITCTCTSLESIMKKISTFAAAAAVTLAAAAPVAAEEEKVNSDPFVSSQGSLALGGLGTTGALVAGTVATVFAVAAIESSDDT